MLNHKNLWIKVGWGVRQWEKNKVPGFPSTINTWFSYLLWVQNRFQIENRLKFRELPFDFQKFFPIEIFFSKNFKVITESRQIAQSVRNFILINFIKRYIFDKVNMSGEMSFYLDFVTSHISLFLLGYFESWIRVM